MPFTMRIRGELPYRASLDSRRRVDCLRAPAYVPLLSYSVFHMEMYSSAAHEDMHRRNKKRPQCGARGSLQYNRNEH